ncbi:MAG TPA: NAD-dependent epimerase/dehydratase family protein [Pilimelia sp.]|nr:NAD-dependent epimerase/dehydratase family protein [Pilimelia sp.]
MAHKRLAVVVGGRGVIGAGIAAALRPQWDVVIVSHNPRAVAWPGFRHGDLLDRRTLPAAVAGAEMVVQSATFPSYPIEKPRRRHTFVDFDGIGTEHLVAAAEAAGVRRYLYVSGAGTPDRSPEGVPPFLRAMYRGEQAVLGSTMEGVCLRPALVYGPHDRVLNRIVRLARRWPAMPLLDDGRQPQQPVLIDDLGEVARQAAEKGAPQGAFDVGGPDVIPLDELLLILFRVVGLRRPLVRVSSRRVRQVCRLLERLPGPPLTAAAVDFAAKSYVADLRPLHRAFDVRLTSFEAGLRTYLGGTAPVAR